MTVWSDLYIQIRLKNCIIFFSVLTQNILHYLVFGAMFIFTCGADLLEPRRAKYVLLCVELMDFFGPNPTHV